MQISKILEFNRSCSHNKGFLYDDSTREIFCQICDKKIDPIKAIIYVDSQRRKMLQRLLKHKFEMEQIDKKKRIKCNKCGKFTKLEFNMTWADQQRLEASDENKD